MPFNELPKTEKANTLEQMKKAIDETLSKYEVLITPRDYAEVESLKTYEIDKNELKSRLKKTDNRLLNLDPDAVEKHTKNNNYLLANLQYFPGIAAAEDYFRVKIKLASIKTEDEFEEFVKELTEFAKEKRFAKPVFMAALFSSNRLGDTIRATLTVAAEYVNKQEKLKAKDILVAEKMQQPEPSAPPMEEEKEDSAKQNRAIQKEIEEAYIKQTWERVNTHLAGIKQTSDVPSDVLEPALVPEPVTSPEQKVSNLEAVADKCDESQIRNAYFNYHVQMTGKVSDSESLVTVAPPGKPPLKQGIVKKLSNLVLGFANNEVGKFFPNQFPDVPKGDPQVISSNIAKHPGKKPALMM